MCNHSILFFTDNKALVHVFNKQSCHDKVLKVFICKLVLICLEYNILFKPKHIPGTQNILADSLSRLQVQTFKQLAPSEINSFPTDIPLEASKLGDIITHLTKSSLQASSIPTYVRAWKLFTQFHRTLFQTACFTLPISPATTALFIAYLFECNYASLTVNTYISFKLFTQTGRITGSNAGVLHNPDAKRVWQKQGSPTQSVAHNITNPTKVN